MHKFLQVAFHLELKITTISQKSFDIILRSMHDLFDYMEESLIDYLLRGKLDA
jgi:hypothetical protein